MWAPLEGWGQLPIYFQFRELKALTLPSDLRTPSLTTTCLPPSGGKIRVPAGKRGHCFSHAQGSCGAGTLSMSLLPPHPNKSSPQETDNIPSILCSSITCQTHNQPNSPRLPACLPWGLPERWGHWWPAHPSGKAASHKEPPLPPVEIQDSERQREGTQNIRGKPRKAEGNPTSSLLLPWGLTWTL